MKKILLITFILSSFSSFARVDFIKSSWQNLLKKNNLKQATSTICFQIDNQLVGDNVDTLLNPASVSKLFTTYWALKNPDIGPHHRFTTTFQLSGRTLHILGSRDAFFVPEQMMALISELNKLGITSLDKISFDQSFYFDWSDQPSEIKKSLSKIMNTKNWSSETRLIYQNSLKQIQKKNLPYDFSNLIMTVKEITQEQAGQSYQVDKTIKLTSSALFHHWKEMNVYSTNFIADKLFDLMGGPIKFNELMQKELDLVVDRDFKFLTGSGLGVNQVTCRTTLKLLEALYAQIRVLNFEPQDMLSVPRVDVGTLKSRMNNESYNRTMTAKTGTLAVTSALAGGLYNGGNEVYFAIMNGLNESNSAVEAERARKIQDEAIMSAYTPEGQFEYTQVDYFPLDDNSLSIF